MQCSYGAFEQILQQCLDNAGGSGLQTDPNGSWTWGEEWYWVRDCHLVELCNKV